MFSIGHPHHYYSRLGSRRPVESLIDDLDTMLLGSHPLFQVLSHHDRQQPKFWHHKIQLHGFEPDDIKLTVSDDENKIKIHARHVDTRGEDSDIYESIRNVDLPENVDIKLLKSRLHDDGIMVLQAPLIIKEEPKKSEEKVGKELKIRRKEEKSGENQQMIPVVEKEGGDADEASASDDEFRLNVNMHSFNPEEINVTLKENSLVVKAEKKEVGDGVNLSHYSVSEFSLPKNVKTDKISCVKKSDGQLVISAPYQGQQAITE